MSETDIKMWKGSNGIYKIQLKKYKYITALGIKFEKTIRRVVFRFSDKEKAEEKFSQFKEEFDVE